MINVDFSLMKLQTEFDMGLRVPALEIGDGHRTTFEARDCTGEA